MTKRLSAKVGEYQKDGQTKGRYVEVGVILSGQNGEYVLMDPTINLAAVLSLQNMMKHKAGRKISDRVMVGIFSEDGTGQAKSSEKSDGPDDEIPF